MKTFSRLLGILFLTTRLCQAAAPAEIFQTLEKLVPEAIRLIEAKDYVAVLEALVSPEDLKKITDEKTLTEAAAKFGEKKAEGLLAVLKFVKDQKPVLTKDGNIATFQLPEKQEFSNSSIVFIRMDGRWYIRN